MYEKGTFSIRFRSFPFGFLQKRLHMRVKSEWADGFYYYHHRYQEERYISLRCKRFQYFGRNARLFHPVIGFNRFTGSLVSLFF